jgi:hypothetical protein
MRQSTRYLLWTALLLTLAHAACASSHAQKEHGSVPPPGQHSTHSIVGIWHQGQERLVLSQDGTYAWEMSLICDIPPCPVRQESGTYSIDESTIHLMTLEGSLALNFRLKGNPVQIELTCAALERDWLLSFKE